MQLYLEHFFRLLDMLLEMFQRPKIVMFRVAFGHFKLL